MLASIPRADRARFYAATAKRSRSLTVAIDEPQGTNDAGEYILRVSGPIDSYMYDDEGFNVRHAISDLDDAKPRAIRLLIDSPGGLVSEGLALYADLFARRLDGVRITAEARGTVASSAMFPFAIAQERIMVSESSRLMVHSPWTAALVFGNATQINDQVESLRAALDAATEAYAAALISASGASRALVDEWLAKDTWMTAAQAVERGLATSVATASDATVDSEPDATVDPELLARATAIFNSFANRRDRDV